MRVSIDDATPKEWDQASTTVTGKLYHPEDKHTNPVTKPEHYNKGGIEAIDYIKQQLGAGFGDYCSGNVMKYLHRYKYKNGIEDLRKARQYLDWLIEDMVNEGY
tara:strand:- start:107 stop:418 length:312 start_codon:yes stop_codon:yes gene_type:complete